MQQLLERLRTDFGRKTLGELVQEREAAAIEIERLSRELARRCEVQVGMRPVGGEREAPVRRERKDVKSVRVLLRLRDVVDMVGLSRSSIYAAMSDGRFPKPLRIGARSVRWKAGDVEAWLNSHGK